MKCAHCRGEMHRGGAPLQIDRIGYVLTLRSVPAWVCGQCGESCFEDEIVAALQEVVRSTDDWTRRVGATD